MKRRRWKETIRYAVKARSSFLESIDPASDSS
jgi:hypothetical protein